MQSIMSDIVNIRNLKANNNITKDSFVKVEFNNNLDLIFKSQLKIKDEQIISEIKDNYLSSNYSSVNIDITYFYKGEEKDLSKVNEEIEKLKASIERREKLLSNENYVNRAPKEIVDKDRKALLEEKEKLNKLLN